METFTFFLAISHTIFAFILLFLYDDSIFLTILYKIIMICNLLYALFFWNMLRI